MLCAGKTRGCVRYRIGLNEVEPLAERMRAAVAGCHRLHLAAAYAKSSGVGELLQLDPPKSSRIVLGLGFGLTDPAAVDRLDEAGLDVRVVPDGAVAASAFHPKLSLIERSNELVILSGSGNLTGGGWRTNVEQFEELRFADPSSAADEQRERFERIWEHGHALGTMKMRGEWERYRDMARDRRQLERAQRRELTRLDVDTGRLIGRLANASGKGKPGYLTITHPDWWDAQIHHRNQSDTAAFWRKNVKDFRVLQPGGLFFHLVNRGRGEDERSIEGWSIYSGRYEVDSVPALLSRHGRSLGAASESEIRDRLKLAQGARIGVILLGDVTELETPITLRKLRIHGVRFDKASQPGRGLTLEEVRTILRLGGVRESRAGVPRAPQDLAAE
jgi:HKD family nuclease